MAVLAVARPFLPAVRVRLEAPVDVAADEEVEKAIGIVVEERCARAPPSPTRARLRRDVFEATAEVAVEKVSAEVRHVEVHPAVVVVVAGGHSHRVAFGPEQPRGGSHVGEGPVPAIAIQSIRETGRGLLGLGARGHGVEQPGAVREEDVQPPVVVVVEHGHAPAHGFDEVLLRRGGGLVLEVDSAGHGDVGEGPEGVVGSASAAHLDEVGAGQRHGCGRGRGGPPRAPHGGAPSRRSLSWVARFGSRATSASSCARAPARSLASRRVRPRL